MKALTEKQKLISKILQLIIALLLVAAGVILINMEGSGLIGLAVLMMIWGNNISQRLTKK